MKLKSLLLGSAAALALSTGAQAADPITSFVSLGVCDAYGITGLTIESSDTCLRISGEVEYEWEATSAAGVDSYSSSVDWNVRFEATSQTDAGRTRAVVRLADGDGLANGNTEVVVDQAFVQFGDTTVLSAGRKGSIFTPEIGSFTGGPFDFEFDSGDLDNTVTRAGHVIQIEALVADGFTILAALEDLQRDGTAGLGVQYDAGGISGEAGVLIGNLYGSVNDDGDVVQPINFYATAEASFNNFDLIAGILADDTGDWIASLGATATFDLFTLQAEGYFDADDAWGVAAEAGFDATDTVAVYIGAGYEDLAPGEYWAVYGGVDVDVTENIAVNAEVGYEELTVGGVTEDNIYGELGVTYAPGGGFEASLDFGANSNEVYSVTFTASKSF